MIYNFEYLNFLYIYEECPYIFIYMHSFCMSMIKISALYISWELIMPVQSENTEAFGKNK